MLAKVRRSECGLTLELTFSMPALSSFLFARLIAVLRRGRTLSDLWASRESTVVAAGREYRVRGCRSVAVGLVRLEVVKESPGRSTTL